MSKNYSFCSLWKDDPALHVLPTTNEVFTATSVSDSEETLVGSKIIENLGRVTIMSVKKFVSRAATVRLCRSESPCVCQSFPECAKWVSATIAVTGWSFHSEQKL